MKTLCTLLAFLSLLSSNLFAVKPRISIFSDHISTIAKQEKISFAEAASKVKAMGYEGIDVWVTIDPKELATLDSLGFEHASAIVYLNYQKGNEKDKEKQALKFMKKNGFQRALLVPDPLPEGTSQTVINNVLRHIDAFSRRAKSLNLDIMVEDYDNERSLCYNTALIDRMFQAAPMLNLVFDTGNFLFCQEDVMTALSHFRTRIHHVHLKDRVAAHNQKSPAVGTGIIPIRNIVRNLLKEGYDGWFCIEQFGEQHMLEAAKTAIQNVLSVTETRVVFIGDSITDGDWGLGNGKPSDKRNETDMNHVYGHGFMALCAYKLQGDEPRKRYHFYNRGISGNTLQDLEKRWQSDELNLNPDVISILIGINDVKRFNKNLGAEAITINQWTNSYRSLLQKAREKNPNLKIILCTPFTENSGWRKAKGGYENVRAIIDQCSAAVKQLATEFHATCLEYDKLFDNLLQQYPDLTPEYWIWDSVHPTPAGHQRMADLWLKEFKDIENSLDK